LATAATRGLPARVEAMPHPIGRTPGVLGAQPIGRTRGITGLVYRSVQGIAGLVGGGIDAILGRLVPVFAAISPSPRREALVAALNGVLGDYLEDTRNPLAIPLQF